MGEEGSWMSPTFLLRRKFDDSAFGFESYIYFHDEGDLPSPVAWRDCAKIEHTFCD